MLTVFALLTATAATTTITSYLALAHAQQLVQQKFCVLCETISHVFTFQQQPRTAIGPAFASGSPATMVYADKRGSDSSSSPFSPTTSTAEYPHRNTSSQPASRTNINNDATADSTTTKRNVGITTGYFPQTTGTTQQMTVKNWAFLTQQQQQHNPKEIVITQNRVAKPHLATLPLASPVTCKSTEPLQDGICNPQPSTCLPINLSQNDKCGPEPWCNRHYHLGHGTLC
jgi:hypothetical protein